MKTINRSILLLFLMLGVVSCVHPVKEITYKSYDDVVNAFDNVIDDTTATWEQVIRIATVFMDSICVYTADENSLKHRILGQDNGYIVIDYLGDKYEEMVAAGKEANYDDILPLLDRLYDIEGVWFYSDDDEVPNIWRDHLYISHQNSDNPVHGYFHIKVTLPCEALPEPTVQIFYPKDADKEPIISFCKYLPDGSAKDDEDTRETIHLDNWIKKNEREEGQPMYASGGKDLVDKMLSYDVLYLMFLSGVSKYGDPSELELSRLELQHFQMKWKEVNDIVAGK